MFVVEIDSFVTDAKGNQLEVKTWTIGDSEQQAIDKFKPRGRTVVRHRVMAGNLPRVASLGLTRPRGPNLK